MGAPISCHILYGGRLIFPLSGTSRTPCRKQKLPDIMNSDRSFVERANHAIYLAGKNDSFSIETLCRIHLKDESAYVRAITAKALGNTKNGQAVPDLMAALERETRSEVKLVMIDALRKIGDPFVVRSLIEVLDDCSPSVRAKACEAMGELGDKRAFGILKCIHEEDPSFGVRVAAGTAGLKIEKRIYGAGGENVILSCMDADR